MFVADVCRSRFVNKETIAVRTSFINQRGWWLFCMVFFGLEPIIAAGQERLFVRSPTIRSNPIERVPLVAIVDCDTQLDSLITLEIDDGQRQWKQPPVESLAAATAHHVAVLGMRPARRHSIRVHATARDGSRSETSEPLVFETAELPANFPPLKVTVAESKRMEPGLTWFATNLWIDDESMMDYGYIIALDAAGEVVWYCHTQDRIADMRVLDNGHLLYQHGNYRFLYEIDLLGRDVRSWYGSNLTEPPNPTSMGVAVDTMHHEVIEMTNGNFLTLATELIHVEKFPTSLRNANASWEPAHVVSDAIIEFQPSDGRIVRRIALADLVDRQRIGYLSLGGFWKDKYDHLLDAPARDWMHANGLVTIPGEEAVVVSLRHLDCLIKVDMASGTARWILGDPSGWKPPWQALVLQPVGDWPWSYHQHAPQWTPRGTLRIYDNGNYRARPFDKVVPARENASRIVEYEIDEGAMTVTQTFAGFGVPGDMFYCPFYGEADELPLTGNLLVTNGGHIEAEDGTPIDEVPGKRQWARIFEMTRVSQGPAEKVFEVICDSGLGSRYGWSIYRAQRLRPGFVDFDFMPPVSTERAETRGDTASSQVHPRRPAEKKVR